MMEVNRSFFKNKKVLVTGGCGFIGSHLASALVNLDAHVTVFDCIIAPMDPRIHVVQGDIRNYTELKQTMKDVKIVFHFAAVLGVEKIINIPVDVLEINLGGTINALKTAFENRVEKFFFSSSSEVYGEPIKIPIAETDPKAPISTYGISKLAGEAYCNAFHFERGLKTTCLRYFNAYGPGQKEMFSIPIFASRVLNNLDPIIYGHGTQYRCYTYIDDIVAGTLLAAASEEAIGETFNIGNDQEVSIRELAEYIIRLCGKGLKPVYKNFGEGIRVENREIFRRKPDIFKACSTFGFEAQVTWEEGVKRFVEWYRRNMRS